MPYVRHMLSKFCRFRSHSNTCVHFCRTSGIIILYPFQASKLCVCYLGIQILWYFQNYWDGMECPVYQLCPIPLWPHWVSCSCSQENLFTCGFSKAVVPTPDVWDTTGFWFVFIYVSMCFFMPIFFFITRHSPLWTCFRRERCCSEEVLRQNASSQKEVSVLPVLLYFGEVCI